MLHGEYDIKADGHEGFFEAYLGALARAIDEGVISNPELIGTIDRIYEKAVEEDVSMSL